ncbi:MAG TPA: hypothetical protein VMX75_06715, partial [Spirochaetia bacterium]|nr:hypothetical protein [Spirochaetia bacterium]
MGIPFTLPMGFLFTATMGKLFTMTLGFQLTISTCWAEGRLTPQLTTFCSPTLVVTPLRLHFPCNLKIASTGKWSLNVSTSGVFELPPKNWTGGEGALRPTFLSEEVW